MLLLLASSFVSVFLIVATSRRKLKVQLNEWKWQYKDDLNNLGNTRNINGEVDISSFNPVDWE